MFKKCYPIVSVFPSAKSIGYASFFYRNDGPYVTIHTVMGKHVTDLRFDGSTRHTDANAVVSQHFNQACSVIYPDFFYRNA